jgi:hypothetical protein
MEALAYHTNADIVIKCVTLAVDADAIIGEAAVVCHKRRVLRHADVNNCCAKVCV